MAAAHPSLAPVVRRAVPGDLLAMGTLAQNAYRHSDVRHQPRAWPDPTPPSAEAIAGWAARAEVALGSDPGGCWVAEVEDRVVGLAVSRIREGLWILSSYAVAPTHQGRGLGRALLDAALEYGRGCLRGMFCSSADPGAIRRYRSVGFDLHPFLAFRGRVDRAALPVPARVRDGSAGDIDLLNSVDRATRGAAHGIDHEVLLARFHLRVVDQPRGQGYVYVAPDGSPALLAASGAQVATDLMWEALAMSPQQPQSETTVFHVTSANQWALDVALSAGLSASSHGHLAVRHMKPPRHYLPHGSLL